MTMIVYLFEKDGRGEIQLFFMKGIRLMSFDFLLYVIWWIKLFLINESDCCSLIFVCIFFSSASIALCMDILGFPRNSAYGSSSSFLWIVASTSMEWHKLRKLNLDLLT